MHPKAASEKRAIFCEKIKEYKEQGASIGYVGEISFSHGMPRTHGYAIKGQHCVGTHYWGAKGSTSFTRRPTVNKFVFFKRISIDAWVLQDLIPKLPKKSIIVMDITTFHKSPVMKKALELNGDTFLYLPRYSLYLNLIEHKWNQAKARRRKSQDSLEKLLLH